MIPSVQDRKKNVHIFMKSYPYLCRLQNLVPNANIKVDNSNNRLEFFGDRLKIEEWNPVLEAISNDRSLHFISLRSKQFKAKVIEEAGTEMQIPTPKSSPLFTNCILLKIAESLSKCLSNSPALTGLLLEKIPLDSQSLNYLSQGLEVCQNLQQLSLPYTQIGDDGCASLCHVLRRRLNLVWLNLTGCGLTDKGVGVLCNLVKFQKLNRYGESWKQSLRYRPVNPNIMPGLRRITLNHNPIGDTGVKIFVETIIDDLWMKAVDLQHCDITLVGGEALLNLVRENHVLSVVDIRGNMQVPNSLVAAIVQHLAENNRDVTPEFQWLKEDNPKSKSGRNSVRNSETSISRSTPKLASNTTLPSKRQLLSSLLPNKPRVTVPQVALTRSSGSISAKRSHTTNNTPRNPWNWNSPRRGGSDHIIPIKQKHSPDLISELHSVKEKLQLVSQRLEEETEKRVKIEQELDKYKQMFEFPESSKSVDNSSLQLIFHKFYNEYFSKHTEQLPKLEPGGELEDKSQLQKHDSLESIIKTVNGENHQDLEVNSRESNSSSIQSSDDESNSHDSSSRAQLLFENLISS